MWKSRDLGHRLINIFIILITFSLILSIQDRAYAQAEPKVDIGGIIEVEAYHSKQKFDDPKRAKEKINDIQLSTVEVEIDAEIHPIVKGRVLLLWEEDETEEIQDFLDEGIITISNPDKYPYYFDVGKMYLPFGSFETVFITDPMGLELGEINETALRFGYVKENTELSFGLFNGDIDETDKYDKVGSYFANLGLSYFDESYRLTAGVSYLSNIADTDGLESSIGKGSDIKDYVDGLGVSLKLESNFIFLLAEYIGALENFDSEVFGSSLQPETYNIELGFNGEHKGLLAFKFEKSNNMSIDEGFNFPKKRYGLLISYPIIETASLSFEYMHEKYTFIDKGKKDIFSTQLAIKF